MILRTIIMMVLLLATGSTVPGADRRSKAPAAPMRTVSVREGTELLAALAPDGKRVAFILLGQTWLVDRAGGTAVALTDVVRHPREDWNLAWAPDSRRLAVMSLSGEEPGLRVVDVNSRHESFLSDRRDFRDPAWSPDGTKIIINAATGSGAGVWSLSADGLGVPVRILAPPRPAGTPGYSPDGRFLAYTGPIPEYDDMPAEESDLWEVDLSTGKERPLTADDALDGFPAYSPDGRWTAFLSERSGSRQVWLLPRAGGAPQPLTRNAQDVYLGPLTWLPDSRGVVYTAAGKIHVAGLDGTRSGTIEFTAELRVAHPRAPRHRQLARSGEQRRARGLVTPELSPDGTHIVFAALGDLWVARVEGGPPRRLTRTPADEIRPRWSPDGTRLAYLTAMPGREREVRVLDLARPDRVEVLPIPATDQFAWSPEGQRLAYLAGREFEWVDLTSGVRRTVATLTSDQDWGTLIGWLPRGDGIAYSAVSSGDWRRHVWRAVAGQDRPDLWELPEELSLRAGWSPDLTRAAYGVGGVGFHARVEAAGTPVRLPDPSPRFYSWSRDGKSLLYLSGVEARLFDVAHRTARSIDIAPRYQVPPPAPPLLIRNARIIEGTGAPASDPADLLICRGRIRQIGRVGTIKVPPLTRRIDVKGRTLLPGLFNLHVNLHNYQWHGDWFPSASVYYGVLAIREVGGADVEWMQSQRERAEAGELLAPRIFLTGGLVMSQNRFMNDPNYRWVDLQDDHSVEVVVAGMAAVGADWITPHFRNPLLDARVIEASHARRLPVTSPFLYLGSLARGLDSKRGVSHSYREGVSLYREDLLASLRAADVCVTPALLTNSTLFLAGHSPVLTLDPALLAEPDLTAFYPPSVLKSAREMLRQPIPAPIVARLRENLQRDLLKLRQLRAAGIRVTAGTNVSSPWEQFGVHLEMELLVKAGLTPLEAIRAATLEGARELGVEDQLGTIAMGKLADFIIVDGNPSLDIRDTRRIQWVVLGGRPYTRPEILEHVRRAAPP